ncbi:enterochelin esterase domain-containing protein [Gibbsiella quercinecans]|uniref:enterochelin esterase domain-containing protein n=1 Tax=Gibbsiella quercinecans TaxID=929813 RepID=UPI00242F508E|nr:enterochelin esterase domain-containing protein [Gibbsiella quercinecans]
MACQHAGSPGRWREIARQSTPRGAPPGNGLTEYHQPNPAQSLQRLPGTEVWFWQTELYGDRRGNCCFIPCLDKETLFHQLSAQRRACGAVPGG